MKTKLLLFSALTLFAASASSASNPSYISDTVNDPTRPEADRLRDANRKPSDMLVFAGVAPGLKVADWMPGSGYFTRLFCRAVGPTGHVYAIDAEEMVKFERRPKDKDGAPEPLDFGCPNVVAITEPANEFSAPEKLDIIWTSQNYHDLHDKFMGPADLSKVNAALFRALKPGGVLIIEDHVAQAGSGLRDTDTLHRIDPEAVKKEVTAAGFVLEAQSELMRNADDPHTANVFDASIRGKTDQFLLKFRKPKS